MPKGKLPPVNTLVARVEAPTVCYNVTSIFRQGGRAVAARLLPYRASGREIIVALERGHIVGDGSIWATCSPKSRGE